MESPEEPSELKHRLSLHIVLFQKRQAGTHDLHWRLRGGSVSPRQRYIGGNILNHIKIAAGNEGKKRIELTGDINNEAALSLYGKTGFEIEGRIRHS